MYFVHLWSINHPSLFYQTSLFSLRVLRGVGKLYENTCGKGVILWGRVYHNMCLMIFEIPFFLSSKSFF